MKLLHFLSVCFLASIFFISCSKSQVNDPVLPPPVDSSGTVEPPTEENKPPVTRDIEIFAMPILNSEIASHLFLGAIVKEKDLDKLPDPVFTSISDEDRNVVTIYTNTSMDDFSLSEVLPSKKTDAILVNQIRKHFNEFPDQSIGLNMASPSNFNFRYNELRYFFGQDQDIDEYLDLGFDDTTKLAEDKGRVIMYYSLTKTSIIMQPPIYGPFLQMKEGDKHWLELLGPGQLQILSQINYGTQILLAMESDSSSAKLIPALNSLLAAPSEDIMDGSAFSKLSAEDQEIIKNTTAYGYSFGDGITLPHQCIAAIQSYVSHLVEVSKPGNIGFPISYYLNKVSNFETYKSTISITDYPQAVKDK